MAEPIVISGIDVLSKDLSEWPTKVTVATMRALNRSIRSGRTVMVREMANDLGIAQKDIRDALAMSEATMTKLEARLAASLKRIPLIDLNARQTAKGVSYRVSGVRKVLTHGFIATVGLGRHRGVFLRKANLERKSPGAWSKNLPIEEKAGPSLGRVFAKYREQALARVEEVFKDNLDHELDFAEFEATGDAD